MSQLELLSERGASLSECARYRHSLWRRWDAERPSLGFIMLNPSVADSTIDDPTIRRCIGFAKREGYGGIRVANLFDLRSTDPKNLLTADDPIGPEPDPFIHLAGSCTAFVAAWGAVAKPLRWRAKEVAEVFGAWRTLLCLGTTKDGSPRHPLYVRGDAPLVVWRWADA